MCHEPAVFVDDDAVAAAAAVVVAVAAPLIGLGKGAAADDGGGGDSRRGAVVVAPPLSPASSGVHLAAAVDQAPGPGDLAARGPRVDDAARRPVQVRDLVFKYSEIVFVN